MKIKLITLLTILCISLTYSQTFQKYIKSSGNASYPGWYSNAIGYDATTSSIFIQADQHNGSDAPAGLIKVDTCGNVLWAKYTLPQGTSYGASGSYYNGGFSVMNRTTGSSAGGYITSILNYNTSGTLVSSTGVNTNASSVVDAHLVTSKRMPNGDILATGYGPVTNHFKDIIYCRMNSTGNVIWSKYSGDFDTYWENGWGCDFDPVNLDCYFVGQNISFSATSSTDIHIIKTDINGNTLWIKNIATPASDVGWCVKILPNQDVVIIGTTTNNSSSNMEITFIKLNSAGNLITACKYGATGSQNIIRNVNTLPNGNLLLTGYSNSGGAGGLDCLNMEVDIMGNIIWQKLYGSSDDDSFINAVIFNNTIFSAGSRNFGNTTGAGYQLYLVRSKLDGTMTGTGCNISNSAFVKMPETYSIFNVSNITPTGFNIVNNFTSLNVNTTQTVVCGKPTASFTPQTPICANQTISLTDQSLNVPNSWTWTSTAGNISNPYLQNQPSITFTAGGTYTVQLKVANCVGVDSIKKVIVVNANPTITPTSNAPLCAGATLSLSVAGAGTYTWSGPSAYGNNTQNPILANAQSTNSGVYTVTLTSVSGCVSTGSLNAIISPIPAPSISGTNALCLGSSINLFANGATSYTWMPSATVATSLNVSPTSNITYTLLAANPGTGCSNTAVYSVTVNPTPTISVTGNSVICNGQNTSLNVTGANSYTWITGSNLTFINVSPTITTTYSVVGMNSITGCTNSAVYSVSVNANPIVTITGNNSICGNQSIVLQASGATSYVWNTSATTSSLSVNPISNTVYSVIGTDVTSGCTSTAVKTVSANPLPLVAISGNTVICSLQNTNLIASGANTYLWSTGSNANSINVAPNSLTSYSIIGTNTLTGCTNTANIQVAVNPLPVVSINGNSTICISQTTTLTASGANTYFWNTTQTGSSIVTGPLNNTNYSVVGTNTLTGCQGSATFFVNVSPNPIVVITGSNSICQGQTSTLFASGANTYIWNTNATSSSIVITPSSSTNYTVTGSNSFGCSNTAIYSVSVSTSPLLSISGNTSVCAGQKIILNASGAEVYNWSTGEEVNSISFIPTVSGSIQLIGTIGNGCTTNLNIVYHVNPIPVPSIRVDSVLNDCSFNYQLIANHDNTITNYAWYVNGNFYSNAEGVNLSLGFNKSDYVEMTVTNMWGCSNSSAKSIQTDDLYESTIYTPNSFTPNGDGLNDKWYVVGACLENVTCYIYDRWGQVVCVLKDVHAAWDGTFNGSEVKDDIYVYKLTGTLYNKKKFEKSGMIVVNK